MRTATGARGLQDVELVAVAVASSGDRADVTLIVGGVSRTVALRAERLAPPRPTSCRADETDEPLHWRVVAE